MYCASACGRLPLLMAFFAASSASSTETACVRKETPTHDKNTPKRPPLEQTRANQRLQFGQRLGDCRLRKPQFVSSFPQIAFLRDADETLEMTQADAASEMIFIHNHGLLNYANKFNLHELFCVLQWLQRSIDQSVQASVSRGKEERPCRRKISSSENFISATAACIRRPMRRAIKPACCVRRRMP